MFSSMLSCAATDYRCLQITSGDSPTKGVRLGYSYRLTPLRPSDDRSDVSK
ncbi:MAG: hypothetical protein AVDCRST_MAG70-966 [uncultured Thermomicrobiales bacterium]|uniref:Uncharacterized protein n=1 Tax=uncultured Thermomicrobiales bacterium TaxID=1645740 RepID=A0A6J4UJV0_9BACT|nr:MAG: hypothetical protein AVDCRST_MAG70-966 [uncultured Thermomicrobiales bacterium]